MTRTTILALALGLPIFLSSCGTLDRLPFGGDEETPEPVTQSAPVQTQPMAAHVPTDTERAVELEAEAAALTNRMGQLEEDLAEVRIELSRVLPAIDELNTSIQENEAAQAEMTANLRPSAPEPAADVVAAAADANRFSVHLASYRSHAAAVEGWSELRQRFNPVLGSLDPRVTEVEIDGRGTFYRLKAGPFQSWGSANEVCDYLRTSSWSCAVMDFLGQDIG